MCGVCTEGDYICIDLSIYIQLWAARILIHITEPVGTEEDYICINLSIYRQLWAERILVHITEPAWTMKWVQRIVCGVCSEEEYNNEMNALFVKLHLLDPQSVIPAYHFLLNQRGKKL